MMPENWKMIEDKNFKIFFNNLKKLIKNKILKEFTNKGYALQP